MTLLATYKTSHAILNHILEVGDVPNGCKMSSPRFLIFTILVEFLHRDGPVGHHARDALLLCMSLSNRHEDLGKHITQYTSFCPVNFWSPQD